MANYSFEVNSYAILYVLQILQEYSDCDHYLTQKKIIEYLDQKHDIQVDRRKVGRDIDRLVQAGFDIQKGPNGRGYCLLRDFEDGELRTLIDSVLFSKYISVQYSKSLIKKLLLLGSANFRRNSAVHGGNIAVAKSENSEFFLNVEKIGAAIQDGYQVRFVFYHYEEDAQLHPAFSQPIVVDPFALVTLRGKYSLIATYAEEPPAAKNAAAMVFFPLDYIKNVEVLTTRNAAAKLPQSTSLTSVLNEHPYGYTGETERVTLRIIRPLVHDLIEDFGKDFTCVDNSEKDTVTVTLRAGRKDIVAWVMQHEAELLSPAYLRDEICRKADAMFAAHKRSLVPPERRMQMRSAVDQEHRLRLHRVDLSCETDFEPMNDVVAAEFSENGLSDFSFLVNYPRLCRLRIADNPVTDLSVLRHLANLFELELKDLPQLASLDFLRDCKKLYALTIASDGIDGNDLPLTEMPLLRNLNASAKVLRDVDAVRLKTQCPELVISTDLRRLYGRPTFEFFDLIHLGTECCRVQYPVWEATLLHHIFGREADRTEMPQSYYGWLLQNEELHGILQKELFPLIGRNGTAAVTGWVMGETLDDIAEKIGFPAESVDHFLAFAWEVLREPRATERLRKFRWCNSPYAADAS